MRFVSLAIFATGVLARACCLSARTSFSPFTTFCALSFLGHHHFLRLRERLSTKRIRDVELANTLLRAADHILILHKLFGIRVVISARRWVNLTGKAARLVSGGMKGSSPFTQLQSSLHGSALRRAL